MKRGDMPVGLAMALAQNPEAMEKFALLSEEKKKKNNKRNTFGQVKTGNARVRE